MAVEDMEEYQFGKRTGDEVVQFNKEGGINSGKTRRKKAQFKNAIKWLAESDVNIKSGKLYEHFLENGIDISNLNPVELATIGLWAGAVTGKSDNYRTLMGGNDELNTDNVVETPDVKIKVIDTSGSEKAFWDDEDND